MNNQPCFVFVDYIAAHSFISIKCVSHLGLEAVPLEPPMIVDLVVDDNVESQWKYENYSLTMDDQVFLVDLICPPLKKIYVIMGMD